MLLLYCNYLINQPLISHFPRPSPPGFDHLQCQSLAVCMHSASDGGGAESMLVTLYVFVAVPLLPGNKGLAVQGRALERDYIGRLCLSKNCKWSKTGLWGGWGMRLTHYSYCLCVHLAAICTQPLSSRHQLLFYCTLNSTVICHRYNMQDITIRNTVHVTANAV